jgi:hypothetical protein
MHKISAAAAIKAPLNSAAWSWGLAAAAAAAAAEAAPQLHAMQSREHGLPLLRPFRQLS